MRRWGPVWRGDRRSEVEGRESRSGDRETGDGRGSSFSCYFEKYETDICLCFQFSELRVWDDNPVLRDCSP